MSECAATKAGQIKTSDIARLMELFQVCNLPSTNGPYRFSNLQSSLLRYWEFEPVDEEADRESDKTKTVRQSSDSSSATRVNPEIPSPKPKRKWGFRRTKNKEEVCLEKTEEPARPAKRMPVIFFDEAHKLFVSLFVVSYLF